MGRSFKQFIYGVFYLGILTLILFSVYSSVLKPPSSCFDGKLNQNETDIDCGGPCVSCEKLRLKLPRAVGPVRVFGLSSGKAVLLAHVVNPNSTYGAVVRYYFHLYDRSDMLLETLSGEERLYPSEKTYIYESNVTRNITDVSRVEIEFDVPEWIVASEMPSPALFISGVETIVENDEKVRVIGVMRNGTPIIAEKVHVIVVLRGGILGAELFASQTVIIPIGGLEEKPFTVLFPVSARLGAQVDATATEVFFNIQ